jgi:hypothetical protein
MARWGQLLAGAAVVALVALPSAAMLFASWRKGAGPEDDGEVKARARGACPGRGGSWGIGSSGVVAIHERIAGASV